MNVVVLGDRFIPASAFIHALTERLPEAAATIAATEWRPDKTTQHKLQQQMEIAGANAVPTPQEFLSPLRVADVVCLHFAPIGRELIAAAPDLRLIAVARTGLENVDIEAATTRGIGVVPIYGRNASAVAELQLGLMLSQSRNITQADRSIRRGKWQTDFGHTPSELAHAVVGMIGFGQVGAQFSKKLAGFECELVAYDPYQSPEALAAHGVSKAAHLQDVLIAADFLVIQARHTPETDRIIGAEQLDVMKPTAYLINVARSRLVDTDALYDHLANGQLAGAGLDVHDDEPLSADSVWRLLENVTLTTHFGGDTTGTNSTSAALVAARVAQYLETGIVPSAINAPQLGWV